MKIKIGDDVGGVRITGLYKDRANDEFIEFEQDGKQGIEWVEQFKKRLHEPLDEVDI